MVALAARDKFYLKKMYRCLKDAVLLLQHDVVCLLKEPAYLSHKKKIKENWFLTKAGKIKCHLSDGPISGGFLKPAKL